jgi:long-chain acyl-CoA synthetase
VRRRSSPGCSLAELAADPEVRAEIERGITDVMASSYDAERVKRFVVLGEERLPDSEELTPTSNLWRRGVHAKYAAEIESLYS